MVNVSVVITLFNDDGFVAIPMITVADDVTVAVPVTISVTLTNRYANRANTNPDLFRSSRHCAANSGYGGDHYGILPLMRCRLPGPQLPAQTASSPVRCASAPAAKAATSSCRTCTHSILPWRRIASVSPFRLSPTMPYIRFTPAAARVSAN
jgi:hypothetical protein